MLPTRKSQHHKFLQFPYSSPSSLLFLSSRFLVCSHGLKRDTAAGRYIFIYFRYTANRHATTLDQQEFISYYFLLVIYYRILYVILYINAYIYIYIDFFSIFCFFFCFAFFSSSFFASSFYLNSLVRHSDIHIYACTVFPFFVSLILIFYSCNIQRPDSHFSRWWKAVQVSNLLRLTFRSAFNFYSSNIFKQN